MQNQSSTPSSWLRSYYFARAVFSVGWIAADLVDARVNGGLKANPSQAWNVVVSMMTALAVIVAAGTSAYAVLAVFGVWAILSGLLQLYTGVRRWRVYGAQWVMILSGAQSALAGGFMISRSLGTAMPTILDIAPYAGFGAFYFLLSAIWLVVASYRKAHA
jgi:uncharacterized membrane protein HdeD (DUF308 family)